MIISDRTCCFIGHRSVDTSIKLMTSLYKTVEDLIKNEEVDTFLFGSKSQFNKLCHKTVTQLKEKYPHIKRIYVRAEFPFINEEYRKYLLTKYEDTYYPQKILNAHRAVYIERNYEMINSSRFCIIYFDKSYTPSPKSCSPNEMKSNQIKSGTKLAYDYAQTKGIHTINLFNAL